MSAPCLILVDNSDSLGFWTGNSIAPIPAANTVAIIIRKPEETTENIGMYLRVQVITTAIRTITITDLDFLA